MNIIIWQLAKDLSLVKHAYSLEITIALIKFSVHMYTADWSCVWTIHVG